MTVVTVNASSHVYVSGALLTNCHTARPTLRNRAVTDSATASTFACFDARRTTSTSAPDRDSAVRRRRGWFLRPFDVRFQVPPPAGDVEQHGDHQHHEHPD